MKFVVVLVVGVTSIVISFDQALGRWSECVNPVDCGFRVDRVACAAMSIVRRFAAPQTRDDVLSRWVDRLQELSEGRSSRWALLNARHARLGPPILIGAPAKAHYKQWCWLGSRHFGGVILSSHIVIVIAGAVYGLEGLVISTVRDAPAGDFALKDDGYTMPSLARNIPALMLFTQSPRSNMYSIRSSSLPTTLKQLH